MTDKQLNPNYLLTLVRHLEQMGLSNHIVEQTLGTDLAELENAAANGQTIPLTLYSKVYRFYLQQMAGENFGFPGEIGDVTGRYQMLYTMMVNSKNLGDALKKLHDFYATFALNRQLIQIKQPDNQRVSCEFTILIQKKYQHDSQPAIISANLIAGFHRMMCWLTGVAINLQRVDIAGKTPERPDSYRKLFSCPVSFNGAKTTITFPADVMNYGIVQTEESLTNFLNNFPESLFNDPKQEQLSISDRVQAIIGHNLHRTMPGPAQVSQMLDLSESSLKRALKNAGSSYHQMIESARKQQAIKLLTQSSMDLNGIADQLGFPATSAFHRSFKRWTGLTPGEYRKKNQ